MQIMNMNAIALNNPPEVYDPVCAHLLEMAEHELAAFVGAVTKLYGAERAEIATQDWLQELSASQGMPASAKELRRITVNASARLASRAE